MLMTSAFTGARSRFDPFSVMLFKALQVVAFLFFIALLAISPKTKDGQDRLEGRVPHHHGLAGQPSGRSRPVRARTPPAT